jgi:hypothetical protein
MIDFERAYGARKLKVMPRAMIDRRALLQFAALGAAGAANSQLRVAS